MDSDHRREQKAVRERAASRPEVRNQEQGKPGEEAKCWRSPAAQIAHFVLASPATENTRSERKMPWHCGPASPNQEPPLPTKRARCSELEPLSKAEARVEPTVGAAPDTAVERHSAVVGPDRTPESRRPTKRESRLNVSVNLKGRHHQLPNAIEGFCRGTTKGPNEGGSQVPKNMCQLGQGQNFGRRSVDSLSWGPGRLIGLSAAAGQEGRNLTASGCSDRKASSAHILVGGSCEKIPVPRGGPERSKAMSARGSGY